MGKFDGYLICSDCDGTLTDSKGELSQENANAIRYFQDNGGLFTVATGRAPDFIDHFQPAFKPNTLVIGLNGTVLYDPLRKKIIDSSHLDDHFGDVITYINSNLPFDAEVCLHSASDVFCFRTGEIEKAKEFQKQKPFYKLILHQTAEEIKQLKDILQPAFSGRYHFNRSWPEGLEMHNMDSGKGEFVLRLKKMLGNRVHTTICVGDYENDLSMLLAADIGFAVENAIDEVKKAADLITVSNDQHAIAHIIGQIETMLSAK